MIAELIRSYRLFTAASAKSRLPFLAASGAYRKRLCAAT